MHDDATAPLAVPNASCPVCSEPLAPSLSALRVCRPMRGKWGSECKVSFQCHHRCAALAVGADAVELERSLRQQIRDIELNPGDDLRDAVPTRVLAFFSSGAQR